MKGLNYCRNIMRSSGLTLSVLFVAALALVMLTPAFAAKPPSPGQASITLTNCNGAPCNTTNTAWALDKTPHDQSITDNATISWIVTATKGATSDNFLQFNGVITVTNTGTAAATIGNIIVNLQTKLGANNWKTVSSDIADAFLGDAATTANICSTASSEGLSSFSENAASGTLEFTDASDNSVFSLVPQVSLAPKESITLLYTATFKNSVLLLAAGTDVRAEAIVTFGNAGARGGSGASCTNVDINGDGTVNTTDEANVRSVPCRVTEKIPPLENGNSIVTLSDFFPDDIGVSDTSVAVSNFLTNIGLNNTGSGEPISANTTRDVSIDEVCSPPGAATVTNTAHLDGTDIDVTVQGAQIGIDPVTGLPIHEEFTFVCVAGISLDASANAGVTCNEELPLQPNACTYTKGGYGGTGVPGQIFNNNFVTDFPSGLIIGIDDGSGPKHDAKWTADSTGKTALKTYLTSAAGGANTALTADTLNATSTSGGNLPRQTATLALNIGFALGSDNTVGTGNFGSLKFCNLKEGDTIGTFTLTAAEALALNGTSVSQVLADANNALDNVDPLPSYVGSFGDLNQLVTALNESFDNCTASAFATAYLFCTP